MNLEEMVPHYKLGKEIEFKIVNSIHEHTWLDFEKYENNWSFDILLKAEYRLKPCKKYPALYSTNDNKTSITTQYKFSTEKEAKKELEPTLKFIRLVKEIPELIEDGEEK